MAALAWNCRRRRFNRNRAFCDLAPKVTKGPSCLRCPYIRAAYAKKDFQCFRTSEALALSWAAGILTDFAMVQMADSTGPALFVKQITGRFAWRDLARELQRRPPEILIFRAVSPLVKNRALQWKCEHTHTDEIGPRYLSRDTARIADFVNHFPPCLPPETNFPHSGPLTPAAQV